jgi:signal transduction histidine kinase
MDDSGQLAAAPDAGAVRPPQLDNSKRRRPAAWRPFPDLAWRRDLALPAVIGVLQLAGAAALTVSQHGPRLGVADWVLVTVGPLALTLRRRYPVAVLWVALAATLAPSGASSANLSLITAFLVAAAGGHRRAAWAVIVAGYACAVWLAPLAYGNPVGSAQFALLLLGWLAGLVLAAEVLRLARARTAEARAARQLDARRRVSEERLRMARDLHDVIGHDISLISVQAGVGLDLWDSHPEQARAALAAIRDVSKDALGELRAMLAALREADEDAPRAPAPGLSRLPELITLTRAAGLSVQNEVAGEPGPLPPAVDVAAYRIIQESLTNVARHAGRARATVRLSYEPGGLAIEVSDDGGPAGAGAAAPPGLGNTDRGTGGGSAGIGTAGSGTAANGSAGSGNITSGSAGSGIAGMRERAAAVGGRLDAGPRPGGGFAVTARLPCGRAG